MRLITEDIEEAALTCYEVEAGVVRLISRLENPQSSSFSILGDYLFMVSPKGFLLRVDLGKTGAVTEVTPFRGIEEISSNGQHLLLATTDGELLLTDAEGALIKRTQHAIPVAEINLGRDATVWLAGGEKVVGGHQVFWSEDFESFRAIPWPASAVHLFGARDGILWTINSREEVWKLHRLGEGNMPGCRRDAGCRNCMYRDLLHARQVAAVEDGFMVLDNEATLHLRSSAESRDSTLQWNGVARFSVG